VTTDLPGTLTVPHRFRGPATSGNGGWTCGRLATLLDRAGGAVRVRLSAPPPLDVPMRVEAFPIEPADGGGSGLRLLAGDLLVAEAVPAGEARDLLIPVPPLDDDPAHAYALAVAAGTRYPGRVGHPFPECLACGTGRAEGDGLRLRPGPGEPTDGTVAAAWVPHPAFDAGDGGVDLPITWAALDCPGGWSADLVGRPMVLGTMTARIDRRPAVGERCVVRGVTDGGSARTLRTRTTLYGQDGRALALAAQVWVVVDPAAFERSG